MADPDRPVIWSPEALADLSEIWDYYAKLAGPQTADTVVRDIENACRLIETHPLAGRERRELRPGLRPIAARPYVIFYRLADGAGEIVRVLHGRRDIDAIFADDPTG